MPNVSVPIAIQRKAEVIERLSSGETVKAIAQSFGCHPTAITHALKDDQDYLDAQIDYHARRLDSAEEMILAADDSVSCTRAQAYHRAVSWRAGVEQARIWGSKQETTINHGISMDQALGAAASALLDKMRVVSTQDKDDG